MKYRYIKIPSTWKWKDVKELSVEENQEMVEHYENMWCKFIV